MPLLFLVSMTGLLSSWLLFLSAHPVGEGTEMFLFTGGSVI